MKQKIIFYLAFAAFAFKTNLQLYAQNDKVYLNNQSSLVGKLIYYKPNDTLILELKTGQTLIFMGKDVKKVVMGETKIRVEKPYEFRERGMYNVTYFNINFAKTPNIYGSGKTYLGVALQNITGFQFNRKLGTGLGLGLDNYYISGNDANVLSVFNEIRGYLNADNQAFYYSVSSGVGFPLKQKSDATFNLTGHKGGIMFYPAIGLRFGASPKFNFFMDIGTKFQRIYINQINQWAENRYAVTYQRWVLRGGIMF
jgi:hypothetical protein